MLDLLVYVTALLRCEIYFENLTGSALYVSAEMYRDENIC